MAWVIESILNGEVPDAAQAWLRSGTQLALLKDEQGGIRPAVMGCGLRRLVARTATRTLQKALRRRAGVEQYGVALSRGIDQLHRALTVDMQVAPEDTTVGDDAQNAHNSFCRDLVRALCEHDPELAQLSSVLEMFVGEAVAELYYYGRSGELRRTFYMYWGGHQGCALTSFLFPLALAYALALVDDGARVYAYQDDLIRRASLLALARSRPLLERALKRAALGCRASKRVGVLPEGVSADSPDARTLFEGARQGAVTTASTGGIRRALGAPITTSQTFADSAVSDLTSEQHNLFSILERMAVLYPIEARTLLRDCVVRRSQHLLSMLPPGQTAAATLRLDEAALRAALATCAPELVEARDVQLAQFGAKLRKNVAAVIRAHLRLRRWRRAGDG